MSILRSRGSSRKKFVTLTVPENAIQICAPPPAFTHSLNCEFTVGVLPGAFSSLLIQYVAAGGRRVKLGRTVAVETAAFVSWLTRRETTVANDAADEAIDPDDVLAA